MLAVIRQRFHKHLFKSKLKFRNFIINDLANKEIDLSEYYFAYGANLNISRFKNNHMKAIEVGSAYLKDHELRFSLATEWKDKGYAGVHEKKSSDVYGVLFKIDKVSLSYLDKLEWCGFGAYERVRKTITCNDKSFSAWVYVVKYPDEKRIPSQV